MPTTTGIPYLSGNESISAGRMNNLHYGLDSKLSQILSNKMLALGQKAQMPQSLFGRTFFFSTGLPVYAPRFPGWVANADGTTRTYTQAQYTTLLAGIATQAGITYDEVNKVALLPGRAYRGNWSSATAYVFYNTVAVSGVYYCCIAPNTNKAPATNPDFWIPCDAGTGTKSVFDGSLQALSISHKGASDAVAVPYYLQENAIMAPEKRFDWAVAELVIEGPGYIGIDATWDKFNFFRIHNCNPFKTTVYFGTAGGLTTSAKFSVELPAWGSATVRRSSPTAETAGYELGYNYLFRCKGGDPRFYWFIPQGDGRSADGMAVNNLTNPTYIYDLVKYFTRPVDTVDVLYGGTPTNSVFCNFIEDKSVQCDIGDFYKTLFGDPSVPTTIFGDLIHHKGPFAVIRRSKTLTDGISGFKRMAPIEYHNFNGYGTIVADFATIGITVAEDANGNYKLTGNDAANDLYIIPFGTNLFKVGEKLQCISLAGTASFTIENLVFESVPSQSPDATALTGAALTATPPQVVYPATLVTTPTNATHYNMYDVYRSYNPLPAGSVDLGADTSGADYSDTLGYKHWYTWPIVTAGSPTRQLNQTTRTTTRTLNGVHKYTVNDITGMSWWGVPSLGSQASANYSLTASLKYTTQGLALIYTEQYLGPQVGNIGSDENVQWRLGHKGERRNGVIFFRGHGFGYVSDLVGGLGTGWLSPRVGRFTAGKNFIGEVKQVGGADFKTQKLETTEQPVKTLRRLAKNDGNGWGITSPGNDSRFWQSRWGGDNLLVFLQAIQTRPLFNVVSLVPGSTTDWITDTGTVVTFPAGGDQRFNSWFNQQIPNMTNSRLGFTGSNIPPVCMCLLPEMYNGLARAINSVTSGVPIDWHTLSWNLGGTILTFDPKAACKATYTPAGTIVPFDPALGSEVNWGSGYYPSGAQTAYFSGPVPIDSFYTFDKDSIFHQFCTAMQIPVKGWAEIQGLMNGIQNKYTSPAIIIETAEAHSSGSYFQAIVLNTTAWPGSVPPQGTASGNGILHTTINITLTTELLSSAALLAGQATGSMCDGAEDPDAPTTLTADRHYLVASRSQTGGPIKKGDLFTTYQSGWMPGIGGGGLGSNPLINPGYSFSAYATQGRAMMPDSSTFELSQYPTTLCYVTLADAEAFLQKYGFKFTYLETFTPLSLGYWEDPFTASSSGASGSQPIQMATPISWGGELANQGADIARAASYQDGTPAYAMKAYVCPMEGNYWASNRNGTPKPIGTLIRFYEDTSTDPRVIGRPMAKWKTKSSYGNNNVTPPVPIFNIKARSDASHICRYSFAAGNFHLGQMYDHSGAIQYWDPNVQFGSHHPGSSSSPYDWQPYIGVSVNDGVQPGTVASVDGWGYAVAMFSRPSGWVIPQNACYFFPATWSTPPTTKEKNDFANLCRLNYMDDEIMADRYHCMAVLSYGGAKSLRIVKSGLPAFVKSPDSWNTLDGLYTGNENHQYLPDTALAPGATQIIEVNTAGVTFIEAEAQSSWLLCFDLSQAAIPLTTPNTITKATITADGSWTADSETLTADQ